MGFCYNKGKTITVTTENIEKDLCLQAHLEDDKGNLSKQQEKDKWEIP